MEEKSKLKRKNRISLRTKSLAFVLLFIMAISPSQWIFGSACERGAPISLELTPSYEIEEGITGWVDNKFNIRVFDTLRLNWTTEIDGIALIIVKDKKNRIVYQDWYSCPSGVQNYTIFLNPNTDGIDHFLPDENYTIQVSTLYNRIIPIIYSSSDLLKFNIIKAKSKFVYLTNDDYPSGDYNMGVYVVDLSSYPIAPHYEFNYAIKLIDGLTPSRSISHEPVMLEKINPSTQDFEYLTNIPTDLGGNFHYKENLSMILSTYLARWTFNGNNLFENCTEIDSLDPSHIFSPFDYTGPGSLTNVTSEGTVDIPPLVIQSKTELQRVYSWYNNTGSYQGFVVDDVSSPFHIYGVSKPHNALYLGTASCFDLTAKIISPKIYYYGGEVSSANLTTLFETYYDRNFLRDDFPIIDIFEINALLFDAEDNILDTQPLYKGNITDYTTRTVSFNPDHFKEPGAFRIGYNVSITTDHRFHFFDVVDEFYFCIRSIDFHVLFPKPQWGMSSLLDDWHGYSFQENTKQLDFYNGVVGGLESMTNVPIEKSSLYGSEFLWDVPLTSPMDEGVDAVDIQDYTFSTNPFTGPNSWGVTTSDDGLDYASGNMTDITSLGDFFSKGANSNEGVAFKYYNSKKVGHCSYMYSVPAFSFKQAKETNRWAGISLPVMLPNLGNLYNYENIFLKYDIATNPFFVPQFKYKIRTLILYPNGTMGEMGVTNWENAEKAVERLEFSITLKDPGDYQLLIIVETEHWNSQGSDLEIYIDNFEIITQIRRNLSFIDFAANGGTFTPSTGPISVIGELILPNSIDFTDPSLITSNIAFKLEQHPIQIISSKDDGVSEYSLYLIPVSDLGDKLEALYISSGSIDSLSSYFASSVTLNYLKNLAISQFILQVRMTVPSIRRGVGNSSDRYRVLLDTVQLQVDNTIIQDWVAIPLGIEFNPITLDIVALKDPSTLNEQRNGIFLSIPEQSAEFGSYAQARILSGVTEADGMIDTLFNGTLNIQLKGFVKTPATSSIAVNVTIFFELFLEDAFGNMQNEYSSLIWSNIISLSDLNSLQLENISIELDSIFSQFASGPNTLRDFKIGYKALFTPTEAGLIPSMGVEIIKSSLVLSDLPPEGVWVNLHENSIIYGDFPLVVNSLTADCIGVRFLGSHDGITFTPIGETYNKENNLNFQIIFDTTNNLKFNHDDEDFYLLVQYMDEYKISNSSIIRVIMDNTAPSITFANLVNNDILVEPREIIVNTAATDISHIELWAEKYADTMLVDKTLIAVDAEAAGGWAFNFSPLMLAPGTYNFVAIAYDRTHSEDLAGYAETVDVLVNWIDPKFYPPTPMNVTGVVRGSIEFSFSIGTPWIDSINVYTASVGTTNLPDTGFNYYTTLNKNPIEDLYSFSLDTQEIFGEFSNNAYFFKFAFNIHDYTENHYYLLYVDNQPPVFDISLDSGVNTQIRTDSFNLLKDDSQYAHDVKIIDGQNWVADDFPIRLNLNTQYIDDLRFANYYLEIFKKNDLTTINLQQSINYTEVTKLIYIDHLAGLCPAVIDDGYSFFVDVANGILYTLSQLKTSGFTGYYLFNNLALYPYLRFIDLYRMPGGFPEEYVINQDLGTANALSDIFMEVYDALITNNDFDLAYTLVLTQIKPRISGLTTNEYEMPWTSPERILLASFSTGAGLQINPRFDLAAFPDSYIKYSIDSLDDVGNFASYTGEVFLLDKGTPEAYINYPEMNEQVLIPNIYTPNQEIILNSSIYVPDADILTVNILSVVAYTDLLEKNLEVSTFQIIPNHRIDLNLILSPEVSRSLIEDFIENPTINLTVSLTDYAGLTTIIESQFKCVTQFDNDAPVIYDVILPDPNSLWTGGFEVVLNTTDGDYGSGIKYIEVWIDRINPDLAPGEILFPIISYDQILGPRSDYPSIFDNFVGLVVKPDLDGLYRINPWALSDHYTNISTYGNGEHTFYLRVFDNNWNSQLIQFNASIIKPIFNLVPGAEIHTTGLENSIDLRMVVLGDAISNVTFILFDENMQEFASILDLDSSNGWGTTFSNLENNKNYYFNFSIRQTDGSTISQSHTFEYPSKVAQALFALEYFTGNEYTPYPIEINNDIPYDFQLNLHDGDVIHGTFELCSTWFGDGTIAENSIKLYIDGTIANPAYVYEIERDGNNNRVFHKIFTNDMADGVHSLRIEVLFTNEAVNQSEIISFIVDNSPPNWISYGVSINDKPQDIFEQADLDYVQIFTNKFLDITVAVQDPHTNVTFIEIWIEIDGQLYLIGQSIENGHVINRNILIDLSKLGSLSLADGQYFIYIKVLSAGGSILSNRFLVRYKTSLPEGMFDYPNAATLFEEKTLHLQFRADLEESLIESIEFFIQTDGVLNPPTDSLASLGYASLSFDDASNSFVYSLDYLNEKYHDVYVEFWAKITDKAGNTNLIPTTQTGVSDRFIHHILLYKIQIDNFQGVYYLEEGQNIAGHVENYADYTSIQLSVYDGSGYVPIGVPAVVAGEDGAFEIEWNHNIPEELEGEMVPISYLQLSDNNQIELSTTNFAAGGKFSSTSNFQIALFTGSPYNKIYIFKHLEGTVYEWEVAMLGFSFSLNGDELIQVESWDYDKDFLDEIILLTGTELSVIEWQEVGSNWAITTYPFFALGDENNLNLPLFNPISFTNNDTHIFIADKTTIYTLSRNAVDKLQVTSYTMCPVGENLIAMTYGDILGQGTLVIATHQRLYYRNASTWNLVFETRYNLLDAIWVENLNLNPSHEIIFGVYGLDGIDILRGEWNSDKLTWEFFSSITYTEISKIYNLRAGHLGASNYGNIYLSHEQGLDIISNPSLSYIEENQIEDSFQLTTNQPQAGKYVYTEQGPYEPSPSVGIEKGQLHTEGTTSYVEDTDLEFSAPAGYATSTSIPVFSTGTYGDAQSPLASLQTSTQVGSDFISSRVMNDFSGGYPIHSEYIDDKSESQITGMGNFGHSSGGSGSVNYGYFNSYGIANDGLFIECKNKNQVSTGYFEDFQNLHGSATFDLDYSPPVSETLTLSVKLNDRSGFGDWMLCWLALGDGEWIKFDVENIYKYDGGYWPHYRISEVYVQFSTRFRGDGDTLEFWIGNDHFTRSKTTNDFYSYGIRVGGGSWTPADVNSMQLKITSGHTGLTLPGMELAYDGISVQITGQYINAPDTSQLHALKAELYGTSGKIGEATVSTASLPIEGNWNSISLDYSITIPSGYVGITRIKLIPTIYYWPGVPFVVNYFFTVNYAISYTEMIGNYKDFGMLSPAAQIYWDKGGASGEDNQGLNDIYLTHQIKYYLEGKFNNLAKMVVDIPVSIDFQLFDLRPSSFGTKTAISPNIKTSLLSDMNLKKEFSVYFWNGVDWEFIISVDSTTIGSDGQYTFPFRWSKSGVDSVSYNNAEIRLKIITYIEFHNPTSLTPAAIFPNYCLMPTIIISPQAAILYELQDSFLEQMNLGSALVNVDFELPSNTLVDTIPSDFTADIETKIILDVTPLLSIAYTPFPDSDDNESSTLATLDFRDLYNYVAMQNLPLRIRVTDLNNIVNDEQIQLSVKYIGYPSTPQYTLNSNYIDLDTIETRFKQGIPTNLDITISCNQLSYSQFLAGANQGIQYGLEFSLWGTGINTGEWYLLNALPLTSLSFVQTGGTSPTTKIDLFYGNQADAKPGYFEQEFEIPIHNTITLENIEIIKLEMKGIIAHYVWESQYLGYNGWIENQNFYNVNFHSPNDDKWILDNNGKTLIQILNQETDVFFNMVPSFDNEPDDDVLLEYYFASSVEFSKFIHVKSNGIGYLNFRIAVDHDAYLQTFDFTQLSNLIKIHIDSFNLTTITYNSEDTQTSYQSYKEIQNFNVRLNDLNFNTLNVSAFWDVTISTKLLNGIALEPNNEKLVWGENPTAVLQFRSKLNGQFYTFQTSDVTETIVGTMLILSSYGEMEFYSKNQMSEFIFLDGSTYFLDGRFILNWKLMNLRKEQIILNCESVQNEVHSYSSAMIESVQRINNDLSSTFAIKDIDGDGDYDILLDDGSLLFHQASEVTYSMKLSVYDGEKFIVDKKFLASRDTGVPHPQFYGYEGTPEFGNITHLNLVDYSVDLTQLDISYSYAEVGPYTTIYSSAVTSRENYFNVDINTIENGLNEGQIFFKAVMLDDDANAGTTILRAKIDRTAPVSTLQFTGPNQIETDATIGEFTRVSLIDGIELVIGYNGLVESDITKLHLRLNNPVGTIWLKEYKSDLLMETGQYVLRLNLVNDILSFTDIEAKQMLSFEWYAVDHSGNVENILNNKIHFLVDSDYEIIFTDPDGTPKSDFVANYAFNDIVYGRVLDSFNQPLPKGFDIDVQLDGLTFLRTQVIDNVGRFITRITSTDLYSPDIRKFDGVKVASYEGTFSQNRRITLDYDNDHRAIQTDALKRFFIQFNKRNLLITYENISFGGYDKDQGFEGFHVDLFVPASMNPITGGTFQEIQIQFNATSPDDIVAKGTSNLEDSDQKYYYYALNSAQITALMNADPNIYVWEDMYVKHLSIDIPFYELKQFKDEFNLSKIHAIKIIGKDSVTHPGLNLEDPTNAYQVLISGGIFLIDNLNNATLYYGENPKGLDRLYETISADIKSLYAKNFKASTDYTMRFAKSPTQILSCSPVIDSIYYFDNISLSGITFNDGFTNKSSGMILDYFWLSAINATGASVHFGVSLPAGISKEKTFLIIAKPGTYSNLRLEYSGNAVFEESSRLLLPGSFEVLKTDVLVDILNVPIDAPFELVVDRNQTKTITGQLIDVNKYPLFDYNSNFQADIELYKYFDSSWIYDRTETLRATALLFGISNGKGNYNWFNTSLLQNGFFNLTIENFKEGNFPLLPGKYICAMMYLGNEYYEPSIRSLIVNVQPSDVVIEMQGEKAEEWVDIRQGFNSTLTYTDAKTYIFKLTDWYDGAPLVNAPVWLQFGIVPNSYDFEKMTRNLANTFGDYLILQDFNAPEQLMLRYYKQGGFVRPIVYPYLDKDSGTFKVFGPLYYQMGITDKNGLTNFTIEGTVFKEIMKDWYDKLDFTPVDLDEILLYMRVFYSSSFDTEFMKIPEKAYYGSVYSVDFFNNSKWIYDYSDTDYIINNPNNFQAGIYNDPYHKSAFGEGIVKVQKEDTMLLSYYQEVTGPDYFYLSAQVVEANIVNGQYIPEPLDYNNFIEKFGLSHLDKFTIKMEFFDHTNVRKYVDGRWTGLDPVSGKNTYEDYYRLAESTGVVTFNNSGEVYGPQWNRIVPNIYHIRYSTVQYSEMSHSVNYHFPINSTSQLLLKSASTYSIDSPSHLYSIPDMISNNLDTSVNYTLPSVMETEALSDSTYPTLKADITVVADTAHPLNYNCTDIIQVQFMLDGLIYEQQFVSNFSDSNVQTYTVNVPLKNLEGFTPDLSILVGFAPNPELNINWTQEQMVFNTLPGENDWDDFSSNLIEQAWQRYQISSNYDVSISNLRIVEATVREDGQIWNLFSESSYWTYLNNVQRFLSEVDVHSEISDDALASSNSNEFTEDLLDFQKYTDHLNFKINKDCVTWNPNVIEIEQGMEFNVTYTYEDLFTIESRSWNETLSYDCAGETYTETYQMNSGYQLGSGFDWEHSVRSTNIILQNTTNILQMKDAVYFGLNPQQSAEILIDQLYMPYKGLINGTLVVQKLDNLLPADFDIRMDVTIKEEGVDVPAQDIFTWYLNSTAFYEDNTKYLSAQMDLSIPAYYNSKLVDLKVNITLLRATNLIKIYLMDAYISGSENIIRMSNVYPTALRARMFSTNFVYYFTRDAFKFGATTAPDLFPNAINDIYYKLEDDEDTISGNLRDIMNVWDWQIYDNPPEEDPERYIAIENWHYNAQLGVYEELNELFHENTNDATYWEFSDVDERGLSMVKMKFNETFMGRLTQPTRYSGYLKLYNIQSLSQFAPMYDYTELTTRKITVLINPAEWIQQSQYVSLESGSNAEVNKYSTDLSGEGIVMTYNSTTGKEATLTYYLPAGEHDIAITDWSTSVLKPNPTPVYPNELYYKDLSYADANKWFYDDKNYIQIFDYITGLPSTAELAEDYIVVETPKGPSNIYEFQMNIEQLYGRFGYLPIGQYEYLELPFYVDNTTGVESVDLTASDGVNSFPLSSFNLDGKEHLYSESDRYNIGGKNVKLIKFEVHFNSTAPIGYKPNFTLAGLGLFDESSQGRFDVSWREVYNEYNQPLQMNSTPLLPTVFSSKMSPKSIPLELDLNSNTIENILNSIAIYTPGRANAELDLFSIIISDKSTEENQDLQSYYGYNFDQRKNEFNEFMYSMYNTYHGMPDWVSSSGLITNEDMIWTHQIVYDLDYDAYYDMTVLKFDGEGLGNFNNWLQDSALFDFENDGVWDAQEKWDTVVSTYQVSDPATYGNGYYFLSQTKTYIHELWEDLTGDGIFNLMTRNYSYTSLKKGVPNYREYYMDGVWNRVNYFQTDITPDSWTSLTRGILRQYDLDEDGVFEYVEQREDRFQNDPNLDPFEDEELIFETFTKWTTEENGSIQVEQGNALVTELTFILIGPDPIEGWDSGNGFYENNITGQFVVVRNVPVTFDPRPDVSSWKRTANNGVIAWYDSNADGYYEIAFIFTYQSFQEKIAIAVYLSKSGRQEVYTDPKQFKESGDTVIASHWLSEKYRYTDMWDVGWDLALEDHNQLLASNDFWVQTIMDTVGIALIMFAVALAPFSFGASLVITTALFLAFQYLVRPMMMDIFTDLGWLKRDRSHVLGGTDESGCKETLWDYVMEAGDNLLTDFSAWGIKPIPSYVEQAFFTDVEPFYQDLHQWQFLPETPVEQRHPDQDVYVEFEVPTLWAPTADNEIAALDLFQALSNGAVFATQYAELQYLGIEKGIPTYGDILAKQSRHRRVMHEFFFRDGPWGTEHLWLTNDATKDFKTLNKIQEPLNQLAQLSRAKYTFLEYSTNTLGQPQLTATQKSFMNYSDPVVYEIDYMQMCMITKYRSAYEAGQKYNPTIYYTMLAIQAVQTAIGIMAGYAGAALQATSATISFGTALKSVMTQSGTKSAFWSFIKEMFEEMVWENLVSEAAQFFGASEAFAEQLGELIGMDAAITNIKNPTKILTSIRTMVKNMQAMHQYVFSSQAHTTTKASERVSVFTRMRALYVSYRAASLVDVAMMTKMQESMNTAAANAKSGGQLNVVEKLDIISSILGTKVKQYDNHQVPMAQLRQLIRQQLLTKFIEQGANVAEDIRAVLADPTLRALKGLGQGKDGVTRFEFIELQRKVDGKVEKVAIHEDGTVIINNNQDSKMSLEVFLEKEHITTFGQLIAKFDSVSMIDPVAKSVEKTAFSKDGKRKEIKKENIKVEGQIRDRVLKDVDLTEQRQICYIGAFVEIVHTAWLQNIQVDDGILDLLLIDDPGKMSDPNSVVDTFVENWGEVDPKLIFSELNMKYFEDEMTIEKLNELEQLAKNPQTQGIMVNTMGWFSNNADSPNWLAIISREVVGNQIYYIVMDPMDGKFYTIGAIHLAEMITAIGSLPR